MGLGLKRAIKNISLTLSPQVEKSWLKRRVTSRRLDRKYPFEPEAKLIGNITLKSKTVFDIGANTGLYSAVLEDLVGQENLYLFEPLPRLSKLLTRRFPQGNIFNYAVSNATGTQNIQIPYINGRIFETRATLETEFNQLNQTKYTEVLVQKISLDEFVDRHQVDSIGLIKIDVEGHELDVIKGAKKSLLRFQPLLLIEIEQRHHQQPIASIFSLLESMGFKGYFFDLEEFKLAAIADFDLERDQNIKNLESKLRTKYINNFFFVEESSENDFITEVNSAIAREKQLVK